MVVEHGINSPTDPERGAIWCKEKNPQTASKFLHRIVTHSSKVSVSETSSREDSSSPYTRRESGGRVLAAVPGLGLDAHLKRTWAMRGSPDFGLIVPSGRDLA
jgi:hypothetical protein